VGGYAHCGHGMNVSSTELPNYEVPAYNGLGANECLVDVTHGLVDFVAGGELHPTAELNFWYHLLNCGFTVPMAGETDFPGLSRTRRVGTARTYVRTDRAPEGDIGFSDWVDGLKAGRVYFGDGRSHFINMQVKGHSLSRELLSLREPSGVTLTARVAARLEEAPGSDDDDATARKYVYWHLEHARIGSSRNVTLEALLNGQVVERREIPADGELRAYSFNIDVKHSSWVALRILPSGHTAPIFVEVSGKPIRASRRSAKWCLDSVDVIWQSLSSHIRDSERTEAAAAYEHARSTYRQIMSESVAD
jgi:hypothetical protein